MPDTPFDVFGPVQRRQRQMSSTGGAYPDPGYIPDTDLAAAAAPNPQQQLDDQTIAEGQAALAQQQRQQAADQAAQQKAQKTDETDDTENWQKQANADAANAEKEGILTQKQTIPGYDGKDITVQSYQQNPDGSAAYKPADLGIQQGPDGSAYRVRRNQWGGQDWSDPYQAGTNANIKLNATGHIMATPKGKGADGLPEQDVTTQGVTGLDAKDAQGNPDSTQLKVSPSAPILHPDIEAGINAEEQKLLTGNGKEDTGAAGQRVADTVGADADDATQKARDASANYTQAYQEHKDSVDALHDAIKNRGDDDDSEKAYQDALAEEARTHQAWMAATQAKDATQVDADSKTAIAKKAKSDPLAFLQNQSDAQSQATEQAKGNLPPPNGTQPSPSDSTPPAAAIPPDQNGAATTPPATGAPPDPWANFKFSDDPAIAARQQAAMKAYKAMQPAVDAVLNVNDTVSDVEGIMSNPANQVDDKGNPVNQPTAPAPGASPDGSTTIYRPGSVIPIGTMTPDGQFIPSRQQPPQQQSGIFAPPKPTIGPEAPARTWLNASDNVLNSIVSGLANSTVVPLMRTSAIMHDLIATGHGPKAANPNDGWDGRATQTAEDRQADFVAGMAQNGVVPSTSTGRLGTFLTKTAPSAISSTVGTIGVAGGDPLVMAGLLGVGGGTSGYYDAIDKGATPKQAAAAGGYGLALNTALGLVMGSTSKLAARVMGPNSAAFLAGRYRPTVPEAAKFIAADGAAQAALGAATQLGTNATAKILYDPNRPLSDGVAEAALQQGAFAALHFPTVASALLDSTTRGTIQRDAFNVATAVDRLHGLQVAGGQTLEEINAYRQSQLQKSMAAINQNDALTPEAKAAARRGVAMSWSPMLADEYKSLQVAPDGSLQASPAKIQAAATRVDHLQARLQRTVGGILESARKPTDAEKDAATSLIPADTQQKQAQLDQFNAARPDGTAPATTDTLQKASDLAPLVNPGEETQPVAEHFVPIAHAIEQLPDPDAQATATAMIKVTNGRALTDSEQSLILGDPANGVAPQVVDQNTGQPFAKVTPDGRTILTDPGLARIKQLVPAAADVLPRSEMSQLEAPQPVVPPVGKKGGKAPQVPADQPPASSSPATVTPPANIPPPDPALAHLSDEMLQTRIGSMTAATQRAKAGGGNLPQGAQVELARFQNEVERRAYAAQTATPQGGAAPVAKVGDEVQYSRVNGDGQTVQSRGEITSKGPDHYKVIDADDGIERTVPVSRVVPLKPVPETKGAEHGAPSATSKDEPGASTVPERPQAKEAREQEANQPAATDYPDDAARSKVRNLTRVVRQNDNPAIKDRLAEAQAELHAGRAARGEKIDVGAEARKLGVNIIGDTDQITPEHREVVMRAVDEFAKFKKAFAAMDVHAIRLVDDAGGAGMMVVSRGAGETEFHLNPDRLVDNWDGTPSPKTWLPRIVNEEYLHAATFSLLSNDFHAMGLAHDDWAPFLNSHLGKMAKELEQAHGGTLAAEVRDQYGKVDGMNLVLEFARREVQKRLLGATTEDAFRNKPYTASFLRRLLTYIKGKLGLQKDVPQELRRMIAALEAVTADALKANDLAPLTADERAGHAPEPAPQIADEDEDRRARAIGADLRPGQQTTLPSGRVIARDGAGNLVMRELSPDGLTERRIPGDRRLDAHRLTTPDIHEILSSSEQPELPTGEQSHAAHPDAAHSGNVPDQGTPEARGVPPPGEQRRPVATEQSVSGPQAGGEVGGGEHVSPPPFRGERPTDAEPAPATGAAEPANAAGDEQPAQRTGATGGGDVAGGEGVGTGATGQRGRSNARALPPLDTGSRVNRDANARAIGGIKDDGLFPEKGKAPKSGAAFIDRDGGRATITKVNKAKYVIFYRDSGTKKPWKTSQFSSLESATKNLTGRGFYYFGKADAELISKLADATPREETAIVGDKNAVEEDQLHVALASLTDQGKTPQADAVQRELEFRQEDRARTQHEQEQADAIHEHLGPSLAEHISNGGGLPKPGTPEAEELGAVKPNAKIDQRRVGSAGRAPVRDTEYKQLYDAYKTLMSTPLGELNRYQQNLKRKFTKNPLFTDNAKRPLSEAIKNAADYRRDGQALDGTDFVQALHDDITGVPHYPDRAGTWEGHEVHGAVPRDAEAAAQDYLDKNDELPFWLHQAVGKLFRNALRAGGNAVDKLIARLRSGPVREPYPVTVGRGPRWEKDERDNYIPTKEGPDGVVNTRATDSLGAGMSAALAYQEAAHKRMLPVVSKVLDLGSKIYQGVKGKAEWMGKVSDHLGDAINQVDRVLPNLYDFIARHSGVLSKSDREREANRLTDQFVQNMRFGKGSDQFVPRENDDGTVQVEQVAPSEDDRQEYEKELSQKLSQPEGVKTTPSDEARINRLISAGVKAGQNRFVFMDGRGKSAHIYTGADGRATVSVPGDTMFTEPKQVFNDVRAAVTHLVDQGFEFQSNTLEKKLAREGAINRFVAMVMGGLRLGQRRFHFAHDDGRQAALIARKDGKFTVAGLGETKKFQSADAATAFLHDRGFGLMSSKLEKDLRAKGLHPDQAHEPVPYSDQQKAVINKYRAAKGLAAMGAKPFEGLDPKRGGFKDDRGVFIDPAADNLTAHVRGNVDAFADSVRNAGYPNQRVRVDSKRGSTTLAYANPAIHPDTISVNTEHPAFQAFGGLKPEAWGKVASEEYWHNVHGLAARRLGAPFGELMQDIFKEMTPEAVAETMHEYGGGVLLKRSLGQYPDNFPPNLRFEVATEYARKLSQVLDDNGTSEQFFHPGLDVPMSDQTRDIVESNPQAKTRYPLLSGLLDTSRRIDNEHRKADVTKREDVQGNQGGEAATDTGTGPQRLSPDFSRGEGDGGNLRPGRADEEERGPRGPVDSGGNEGAPRTQGPVVARDEPLSVRGRNIQKHLDGLDARVARGEELSPSEKIGYQNLTRELRKEQNLPSGDYFDTPLFSRLQTEARTAGPGVDALFKDNLPLAKAVAWSYRIPGLEPADVEQEAGIGLLKAARTYDPTKPEDKGFRAYANRVIKNHLANLYNKRALRREDTTLDAPLDQAESGGETGTAQVRDASQDTGRIVHQREMTGALNDAIASLPDSARKVMNGIRDGKSQAEIARDLGVTPQRVSNLFGEAREKLRQRLADMGYSKSDVRDLTVHGARPFEHDFDDEPVGAMETPQQKHWAENALGFKPFVEHDVIPAARAVSDTFKTVGDSILKVLAPQLRSSAAAKTARSVSAHLAWAAHEGDVAMEALRRARSLFQGRTAAQNHEFMDAVETDRPIKDPELAEIYKVIRKINRMHVDLARSMPGKHFASFIENYMPHIWQDDPENMAMAQEFYRNKIEGSRAFLKHRSIPTVRDGLDFGLKLVSDNPIDLFLTRFSQMNKYVAGQRILDEVVQDGVAQTFERPEDVPLGWKRIDDRIGLSTEFRPDPAANPELPGMKGAGSEKRVNVPYYAPEEVVQILENHLSPGLRNSDNPLISTPYKIIAGVANTLNQAQLGYSLFHMGFTSFDTMLSQLALATRQAVPQSAGGLGQPLEALKNLVTFPLTPITNYLQGSKLLREWNAPGTQGREFNKALEMAIQGGARAKMDEVYSDRWGQGFHKAWTQGNLPGMAWRAPFAAVETFSKPLLEHLVPRQKLGVFFALTKAELKNLGPDATTDQLRQIAQRSWASVDNRMGQLVYDNLFWDKSVKDAALILTRSVGWQVGTYRELGGGVADTGAYIRDLMAGKHPQFSNRMAYTIALNTLTPALGSVFCYLLTGKGPSSIYDAYFPPTGEKDANGHDVRAALPSYAKDEFATAHDPVGTTENKANPIWASSLQLLRNKDYYGTEIVHPDDLWWQQAASVAKFAASQFEPFSWSGGNQFKGDVPPGDNVGPLRQVFGSKAVHTALSWAPTFGVTPAPKYMSESAAELRAQALEERLHAGDTKTSAEAAKYQARSALRTLLAQNNDSKVTGPAIRDAIKAGVIKPGEDTKLRADAKLTELQRMARDIAGQYERKGQAVEGYHALLSIWSTASPEEQRSLVRYIMPLYDKVAQMPGAKPGPRPVVKAATRQPAGDALSMAK